ncbi:MAG: Response regulator PleD [Chloroflexi bacterium]|nr:Response regulator PleD [Chloroflexota bacterium]
MPQTKAEEALKIAERIRASITKISFASINNEEELQVHISGGVGSVASDAEHQSLDGLIHQADMALYEAKHSGRNRVCAA